MHDIVRILDAIWANSTSLLFCTTIAAWFVLGLIALLSGEAARVRAIGNFVALTPGALATLGVLGTFTGIVIGLLDFDVTDIDASVPMLLAGLKIAFTSSIAGMASALIFRVVRGFSSSGSEASEVTAEDIYAILEKTRFDYLDAAKKNALQIAELRRSISSDGESSLLTQIQKLRHTIHDGQHEIANSVKHLESANQTASERSSAQIDTLNHAVHSDNESSLSSQLKTILQSMQHGQSTLVQEIRDFARHMTENNQKAIIQALEQVIRDFNEKLTEQFGQNFKQLNEAVGRLVDWQDRYRDHVEAIEQRLEYAVAAMQASQLALAEIEHHAKSIPEAVGQLQPILETMEKETQMLAAQLEAIATLKDKAIDAFPAIERNLDLVTSQFADAIKNLTEHSRRAIENSEQANAQTLQQHEAFVRDAQSSRESFSRELSETMQELRSQSVKEFESHGELIQACAKEAKKSIDDAWGQTAQKMNGQFEQFDQQMQHELTRSLQLLGQKLASLSEKFVSDYTPLTNELRKIVRFSDGVR